MKRKILVPHDGYEMSDKALKYAIEIAKAMRMEIIILRVVRVFDFSIIPLSYKERENLRKKLKNADKEAKRHVYNKLVKQLTACVSEGVKTRRLVMVGEPAERNLAVATQENPYMIIIGSRKLKGFGKLKILGSVARKVSENAKCPVTIVH